MRTRRIHSVKVESALLLAAHHQQFPIDRIDAQTHLSLQPFSIQNRGPHPGKENLILWEAVHALLYRENDRNTSIKSERTSTPIPRH